MGFGRLEQRGIEFRQNLTRLYPLIEIGVQSEDRSRHLGADVDQYHRIEGAIGGNICAESRTLDGSLR